VLEVGTGSGYQAAILCEIGCEVYTIERHPQLAETAEAKLLDAGYESVRVVCGDGTQGLPEQAPFDRVLVTAGGPAVPPPLIEQLADGGRLICPVGTESRQVLKVVERHGETLEEQETVPCVFVPLIGRSGW
jgi:protein-L-isoaspartate(D-aspartate) O-methyltransferase